MVQSRLLDISVREFGAKGLEGASTRGIATAAGTAMSSITYHYGGKEGLYLAAADHVAASMSADLASALANQPAPLDAPGARARLHQLLDHLADKMVADHDADSAMFIVREQMNPSEAFTRLYDGPMSRIAEQVVSLVALATGTSRPAAEIVGMLLFGQVLVWRAARAMAARVLGGPVNARTADIGEQITRATDAILDRLYADQQELA